MKEITKTLDDYLKSDCPELDREIWVSENIYNTLDTFEYKGFRVFTHEFLPNNYIVMGKLFF